MSKRFYFEEYFKNNLKNMRKTWEGINNLINRKKKSRKLVTKMRCPIKNEIATSPTEISNIFNKHFSYIGEKLAAKLPNSSKYFSYYLNTNNSFFFKPVTSSEVESEINSMPLWQNKRSLLLSHAYTKMYKRKHIVAAG